ncbi:MAG TPA: hypothetical protein VN958_07615 [Chitinophagaceae bacterium]|nr:hypothetical protein [Chitinophagaceae bacterium]
MLKVVSNQALKICKEGKETLEEIANKAKEKLTELQKDAQIVKNEFAETKRQAQEAKDLSAPLLTFVEKIRDVTTSPFENLFSKIQLFSLLKLLYISSF